MVPSIPRRGGLRNRTEPNIHRNTYEAAFQRAQVISKSTVPLNRHATPHRFTIPTPKQQDTTKTEGPHRTHFLPSSAKNNKIERKIEKTYKHMIGVCMNIIKENDKHKQLNLKTGK